MTHRGQHRQLERKRGRVGSVARWLIALTPFTIGCAAEDDIIARASVDTADAADTADTCDMGCGVAACPCETPPRIAIDTVSAPFVIDATEVTVAAYARFLENQPAQLQGISGDTCAWNESYVPTQSSFDVDPNCVTSFNFEQTVAERPELPVVCVDLCDARDYCTWVHGRLCGASGGGELPPVERASANAEWYGACSAGGTQPYCYGSVFDPVACNTREAVDVDAPTMLEVGALASCEGPVPGLFDMNGNIKEWIASCEPTEPFDSADCYRVGGAFFEMEAELSRCDAGTVAQRSTLGNDTGFRCCYDP